MVACSTANPFREQSAKRKWEHVGGGIDHASGRRVNMPQSVRTAKLVDGLAQRYNQLPSQILNEPAQLLMHLIQLAEEPDTSG